jgi:Ca2+-binding EF-hand superfamily protein
MLPMTRTSLSNTIRLTFGLLAVCSCATALAQSSSQARPQTQQKPGMFWIGDLDANHDGRISPQEAAAAPAIAKQFALLDLNHDGYLTMSEVQGLWGQQIAQAEKASEAGRAAAFDKADKNHDSRLTLDEAKAGMPRVAANFAVLDTKKAGYLTKDQVVAGAKLAAQQAVGQMRQRNAQAFAKADTNHDGKLSQAEFAAAFPKLASSFAFYDENHDGSIEPNEFALPPR